MQSTILNEDLLCYTRFQLPVGEILYGNGDGRRPDGMARRIPGGLIATSSNVSDWQQTLDDQRHFDFKKHELR